MSEASDIDLRRIGAAMEHDLKQPLQVVALFSSLAARKAPEAAEELRQVRAAASGLARTFDRLSLYLREPAHLTGRTTASVFPTLDSGADVEWKVEGSYPGGERFWHRVLAELLGNARIHGGAPIRVLSVDGALCVTDGGRVSSEVSRRAPELLFSRGRSAGDGLGLALVRRWLGDAGTVTLGRGTDGRTVARIKF